MKNALGNTDKNFALVLLVPIDKQLEILLLSVKRSHASAFTIKLGLHHNSSADSYSRIDNFSANGFVDKYI